MKYICNCGNESSINFDHFKRGKRCSNCKASKISKNRRRYSYKFVKDYFEKHNCILLEDSFETAKTKMKYICKCGRESEINFTDFKIGQRCRKCADEHLSTLHSFDYDYVYNYFIEAGCKLISKEYTNVAKKLEYICSCGEVTETSFHHFKEGARCPSCATKRRVAKTKGTKRPHTSRENSPHWKHDKTDEERINQRGYQEYYDWRTSVFKRDDYTCQCCGEKGGSLRSHHLDAYHWAIDKRTDVNNGVTLCKKCHDIKCEGSFHSIYGIKNNTEQQFQEYLANRINQNQQKITSSIK